MLPKSYTAVKTVGKYTIAKKRGMFYIFDSGGGINQEACFTTLERAEAYIPTIDHLVVFTDTLAGNYRRPR